MGFLKHLYTSEYFTSKDSNGNPTGFGALGAKEWEDGDIFSEIKDQIDLIELKDKSILEIGYGRCESARYMLQSKQISKYIGVDFSESAYELAKKTLQNQDSSKYELFLGEALEFLKEKNYTDSFDAVYMLDSIEHIPTTEVNEILPLLHRALKNNGVIIADTPFYSVDEDYIKQGFVFLAPSTSDLHPATKGMHCNKYTKERLFREMEAAGFSVISNKIFQKVLSY